MLKFRDCKFFAAVVFVLVKCGLCINEDSVEIISNHMDHPGHGGDLSFAQQLTDLKKKPLKDQGARSKRAISDHYEDMHCLDSFETSPRTIIKADESKANGALFLNETEFDSYEYCLQFCCQTDFCNVAIFDSTVSPDFF